MGYHVHFKEGKFAVWSTTVDSYVTEWGSEDDIIAFICRDAISDAIRSARGSIERAKENGKNTFRRGCSAYRPFRCNEEEIGG